MNSLIENTKWYSACWLMFYVLLGIFVYLWDRQYLQGLYRWFYNATHKDPLPETVGRSFVYGQKTSKKVMWALVVSTVQSAGLFFFTGFHSNPFVELVLWFLEIPAMVIGFGIGSKLYPYWMKRKKVYEFVDKADEAFEKGELKTVFRTPSKPTSAPPPSAPVPPAPVVQEVDPREVIRNFTKGH